MIVRVVDLHQGGRLRLMASRPTDDGAFRRGTSRSIRRGRKLLAIVDLRVSYTSRRIG